MEPRDRHRFDNPSAWLDREERAKARSEGRPLGFGYVEPRKHAPPPAEKPFYTQEYSFTSGLLVNRKYNQYGSNYKTEGMRADPWHYPNALNTQDEDHFRSHKRRSQNCDPRVWQPDPVLSGRVPETLVQNKVLAERDELRQHIDPKRMEPLFAENVRPRPETLRELNVDLSCVSLPAREGGSSPSARNPYGPTPRSAQPPQSGTPKASSGSARGGREEDEESQMAAGEEGGVYRPLKKDGADKWKWCMGGRPTVTLGQPTQRDMTLTKSRSLPQMLGGISTLNGNIGGPPSPFHGMHTRKFGTGNWDGRMRGGKLARDGWAGTFPSKEVRP